VKYIISTGNKWPPGKQSTHVCSGCALFRVTQRPHGNQFSSTWK